MGPESWEALGDRTGDETLTGGSRKYNQVRRVSGHLSGHRFTNSNLRPTGEREVKLS